MQDDIFPIGIVNKIVSIKIQTIISNLSCCYGLYLLTSPILIFLNVSATIEQATINIK